MLVHILRKRKQLQSDGPFALVLAPEGNLKKIYNETIKFANVYDMKVLCTILNVHETPEVVITTPDEFIKLIDQKILNSMWITYIVGYNIDTMSRSKFGPKIRRILDMCNRDRQILLFNAEKTKLGFSDVIKNPVQIINYKELEVFNPTAPKLVFNAHKLVDKRSKPITQ